MSAMIDLSDGEQGGASEPFVTLNLGRPETSNVDKYSSPIVTLVVGPNEVEFFAHKDFLTKSPFFDACLTRDHYVESTTLQIRFPADDPATFVYMVQFMYTGTVVDDEAYAYANHRTADYHHELLSKLIDRYSVADKYLLRDMCTKIADDVRDKIKPEAITSYHFQQMTDAGMENSNLWAVVIRKLANDFRITHPEIRLRRAAHDDTPADDFYDVFNVVARAVCRLHLGSPDAST